MLDDLIRFLTARLNEDEAQALAWASDPDAPAALQIVVPLRFKVEAKAKRQLLHIHNPHAPLCSWSHDSSAVHGDKPCDTLLALASIYQDHPDFEEGWRP